MRTAASGTGRAEGFAAMDAEANRLKEGRAPRGQGSATPFGESYAACIQWREDGTLRHAYGPRRAEKRRAEEDLEVMREASSRHEDVLVSRNAVDAEVLLLQQQAEAAAMAAAGIIASPRAKWPRAKRPRSEIADADDEDLFTKRRNYRLNTVDATSPPLWSVTE